VFKISCPQHLTQLGSVLFTTREQWALVISHFYDSLSEDDDDSFISGHKYNGMAVYGCSASPLESKPN
jgi:hypothetical protein